LGNVSTRNGIIVGLGAFALVIGCEVAMAYSTRGSVNEVDGQIAGIEQDLDAARAIVKSGPGLQQQLAALEANWATYVKILPAPELATPEKMLKIAQDCSTDAQVAVEEVSFRPDMVVGHFRAVSVALRVRGRFDQFLNFV